MTREEAVKYFKRHLDLYCVDGISREAEEMAIQELSKEQKIKAIVVEWQSDTWTDNFSYECMRKIADIVAESEDKVVQ